MKRCRLHLLLPVLALMCSLPATAGDKGVPFRLDVLESMSLTIRSDLDTLQLRVDDNEDALQLLLGEQDDLDLRITKIENVLNLIESKKIFVTSDSFTGNLGGLDGADTKCQAAAFNAGLDGSYLAWISTVPGLLLGQVGTGPLYRFARHHLPYVRPDGVQVADYFGDLVDGTLDNPISADEFGSTVFEGTTWSATLANGSPVGSGDAVFATCDNWTTDAQLATANFMGTIGSVDASWSAPGASVGTLCTTRHRLVCVEQ